MPYEFDWEIRQIILEVQRISFVLLDLHLELYGSHTHTSLDLLAFDLIHIHTSLDLLAFDLIHMDLKTLEQEVSRTMPRFRSDGAGAKCC